MPSDQHRPARTADGSTSSVGSSSAPSQGRDAVAEPPTSRTHRPDLAGTGRLPRPSVNFADQFPRSSPSGLESQLSPAAADRVFPIRSVVSVDPTPTPSQRNDRNDNYFGSVPYPSRQSIDSQDPRPTYASGRNQQQQKSDLTSQQADARRPSGEARRDASVSTTQESRCSTAPERQDPRAFHHILDGDRTGSIGSGSSETSEYDNDRPQSLRSTSVRSLDDVGGLITARFQHVVTEDGHAVITGRGGETLQRCEDEPIHIPGAVQGFGLLIALEEETEGRMVVRVVSENSKRMIGYTPKQLFALDSFTDILSDEQADNLLDHIDFIKDEDADVKVNGPEVFTVAIRTPQRKQQKLWCAVHVNDSNTNLIICEFELEDDIENPLVPAHDSTPEPPEDTLSSEPTEEELMESTQNGSKPLRVLRSARKRKGEAAAMEVFNIMSQVQEQLAAAPTLEKFLKVLVGVVKELTGFHRVMIYQFDHTWNGRVVTELVDPRATKDLYKGLNFPASDIPKQARDLYKVNKVRMLYDRDQETARLVCRTVEDLETPLDLTYSYLRAMSPIHIKYLTNMAVRSSMSISINAFDELWGLIACHSYGSHGMRVSFPIRKMCRLVGDSASRNIERLSYASRLQARKLINTVPTESNPSGYIIASSEDLLKLFDADFGLLAIRGETKILGHLEQTQEALAMLEYLRMRKVTNVMTSQDIRDDFPDLRYAPGFTVIAGLLLVPLSVSGEDFIVLFRQGQTKEVKWAGNPYEKYIKAGTEGYLEPRKSFKTWSETIVGKCREWTEEQIETAAVLCLVYGKFIEVWRQKEAALQNSQLTKLLLANSAHEVRTPLNAIINYLEIAMEGPLDQDTRDNLMKSHSASKSLIYVINDLLDLTKAEEGGDLIKDEIFDLKHTFVEATEMFESDARRKKITYKVIDHPGLPSSVIGDQRRVRQAISNIAANAIQNTTEGGITIEMYTTTRHETACEIEVSVADTGSGMTPQKLDAIFRELEQVQTEAGPDMTDALVPDPNTLTPSGEAAKQSSDKDKDKKTLGLGLAVVARIVRNMNGQLRLKSEEGRGSRFVIQFPFDLPSTEPKSRGLEDATGSESAAPQAEQPLTPPIGGEVTLVERGSAARGSSADGGPRRPMSRKNSHDSLGSQRSAPSSLKSHRSNHSKHSVRSQASEADRLIEAISEPHGVEGWHANSVSRSHSRSSTTPVGSPKAIRPKLESRLYTTGPGSAGSPLSRNRARSAELSSLPVHVRHARPGEALVADQGQAVRAVRVPDDMVVSDDGKRESIASAPADFASSSDADTSKIPVKSGEPPTADHMCVLVAEDDPVNSRIIKKRLEKLGHEVFLTGNGEECSTTYAEKTGFFDIVLMDMQMPIVDGATSTKMIRSFEKSHPTHILSTRASLNG